MLPSVQILTGDCVESMRQLPDASVQCCVTSPPYWGLRDYGVKGQIGLEATPAEYVAKMVEVFTEAYRVLKDDGTLWLNLGDSYVTSGGAGSRGSNTSRLTNGRGDQPASARNKVDTPPAVFRNYAGLDPKNLIGMPWRVAFALQDTGWYLRQEIIWHKPNPMPESVYDRPTRAHEQIFLLSKSGSYFYDYEAIMEPVSGTANPRGDGVNKKIAGANSRLNRDQDPQHQTEARIRSKQNRSFSAAVTGLVDTRNKRSVWTVPSDPYPGAHFATFPPALILPCVLAGSRPGDVVLDPFGGSGTTGEVALQNHRSAILCELSPTYVKLARKRCATTVGFDFSPPAPVLKLATAELPMEAAT